MQETHSVFDRCKYKPVPRAETISADTAPILPLSSFPAAGLHKESNHFGK